MKVQEGHIPAYLVEAGPVVVALCTACGRRTLRPNRAMMDRHGSVITDGFGDCAQEANRSKSSEHGLKQTDLKALSMGAPNAIAMDEMEAAMGRELATEDAVENS